MGLTRREFLAWGVGAFVVSCQKPSRGIMTIHGWIEADALGSSLIHEHFLVDFIGADKTSPNRWNRVKVVEKVLPYLQAVKAKGVKSMFDCTPAFLGRDIQLLQMLSRESGLQIITNTGYYGAVGNKYLPHWAFSETENELALRWIAEFEQGIEGTGVKPGFIKIGVDGDAPVSDIHKKLVRAAAITHLQTGLTICSHTGPALVAFEEIEILKSMNVHPNAFVWVHAQSEEDKNNHLRAAKAGAWVSLDGIGWGNLDRYIDSLLHLKEAGFLNRVLISHDAGWYKPDEPAADFVGYTKIFDELFPQLIEKGFSTSDLDQLLIKNPAEAMHLHVRKN